MDDYDNGLPRHDLIDGYAGVFEVPTPPATPEVQKFKPPSPLPPTLDGNLFRQPALPNVGDFQMADVQIANNFNPPAQIPDVGMNDIPQLPSAPVENIPVVHPMPNMPAFLPKAVINASQAVTYINAYCEGPGSQRTLCRFYNELRTNGVWQELFDKFRNAGSNINLGDTECYARFLKEVIQNGFSADKFRLALENFKKQSGIPELPFNDIKTEIERGLRSLSTSLALFSIFPWFIIILGAIWLMVAAGWFGWFVGLLLSFAVVFVIYLSTLLLRASVANEFDRTTNAVKKRVWLFHTQFMESRNKIPAAIASSACVYAGPKVNPPPINLPSGQAPGMRPVVRRSFKKN